MADKKHVIEKKKKRTINRLSGSLKFRVYDWLRGHATQALVATHGLHCEGLAEQAAKSFGENITAHNVYQLAKALGVKIPMSAKSPRISASGGPDYKGDIFVTAFVAIPIGRFPEDGSKLNAWHYTGSPTTIAVNLGD